MERKNFKQIGVSLLGALLFSAIPAVPTISKTNVADFQNVIQNPINNVLVQPAECKTAKCNCKTAANIPGMWSGKTCWTGGCE